jgi:molybdate transport system substrate-binding protein
MPRLLRNLLILLIAALPSTPSATASERGPVVLAAASLQEAVSDAARAWTARGHAAPVVSFAASPALARQIEAGAPADLFLSADSEWMEHVLARGLLRAGSRSAFLSNRLVLIAPRQSKARLNVAPGMPLARALGTGRLALADPDSVPAGRYARAALTSLGAWSGVNGKIARAENVRAALALVERGQAPLGVVYATDARASRAVRVLGTFPAASHPPITYEIARIRRSAHPDAERFRQFLLSSAGKAIFARRGFVVH